MITPEQHAEIRRLYYGEHWTVGTIAAALGLHHDTVQAAITHDTGTVRRGTCRPTALDPYLPFVRDTLAQYPRLRATRLYEMVRQRGYQGSVVQLTIGNIRALVLRAATQSHLVPLGFHKVRSRTLAPSRHWLGTLRAPSTPRHGTDYSSGDGQGKGFSSSGRRGNRNRAHLGRADATRID